MQHTPIKYFVESLWRDEAFSWAMASQGLGAVPLTARDFNPPLYYLLLSAWMQAFGSSEVALRSLSLLFFAGTLWVVWRFMTDLLAVPRRRAGVYLLLFALNPLLSYYAMEARMYSLLAFFAAASFYAYQAQRPVVYVLSTTAGLYTHYFMVFVLLAQAAAAILARGDLASLRKRALLLAAPVLLFVPWIAVVAALKESGSMAFWIDPPGWRFALHLLTAIYTGHDATYGFLSRSERWLFALCLVPAVLWALWAAWRAPAQRRPAFLLVASWALLPPILVFVAAFVKPVFLPRYLVFSTVGLVMLLAVGAERLRPAMRVLFLAVLYGLAAHYQIVQASRHSKGEYRGTIRQIVNEAGPADVMYVRSELDYFPAQYYFGADRVFLSGRRYEDLPPFVGKVLIAPERLVDGAAAAPAGVFILQNDHEYSRPRAHGAAGPRGTSRNVASTGR